MIPGGGICSAADLRPQAKSGNIPGNIGLLNMELTLESCV